MAKKKTLKDKDGNVVYPVTKATVTYMSDNESTVEEILVQKVTVVEGKGLSSNDYTNAEKEKLAGLENYDDTALKGRTATLETEMSAAQTALSNKVDKVSGKGLSTNDYTTAEKNKLAGLSNYDDTEVKADIAALETGKVDVVSGKGLSTNDYTTAEKNKLASLSNYDDTQVKGEISALQAGKQDKLTAGTGIDITNNVISATVNSAEWGNITGTLADQTDLQNALNAKANSNLVPEQASTTNQLADKAFVNSTVQTGTANFRGNWTTWENVPTNASDYPADYTGSKTPTVNDYLVVQNAADRSYIPELIGTWRFKYSGTWATDGKDGWQPEYQVNETPMTAAQLAALNSGITSTAVTKLDGIAAGAEVNVQANWAQTNTSADDYIKNKPTIPTKTEWYGTCSTAAGTAAKTVTTQTRDFSLTTGATVYVKMTNANSAASPTLNVDSKGAKSIAAYGTTAAQYYWGAGEMVGFVYDGTRFVIIGKNPATTTYYGVTKLSSAVDSTSTALAATPSAVKSAYDLANTKAEITVTATDPGEGVPLAANHFIAYYE